MSKKSCLFQRRVSQRWLNMINSKRNKKSISNWIHWIQSFYCYLIIFFTLLPILRTKCWRILANSQNFGSWKILHCKNLFKQLHFVIHQLIYNFTRGLVHFDQQSFDLRVIVILYILNVLKYCNAILLIASCHLKKFIILIGWKYCSSYVTQGNSAGFFQKEVSYYLSKKQNFFDILRFFDGIFLMKVLVFQTFDQKVAKIEQKTEVYNKKV